MTSPGAGGYLTTHWVGVEAADEVAATRLASFGSSRDGLVGLRESVVAQLDQYDAMWLLCRHAAEAVGTATSLDLSMWVRGTSLPCQGVADVGTVKTWRGRRIGGTGVATEMMNALVRHGRDKGAVVSALTPFRGAYYERLGYGFVERRADWTVPLSVIDRQPLDTVRFYREADRAEVVAFRRRLTQSGQGDVERSEALWAERLPPQGSSFIVIDRDGDGPITAYAAFRGEMHQGSPAVKLSDVGYADTASLRRILAFAATLRDEYTHALLSLPADLPLNRLLAETQIMHHTQYRIQQTAEVRQYNRLMVRVLDHVALLESVRLVPGPCGEHTEGEVVVAIAEPEGTTSTLLLEFGSGRIRATPTNAEPDLECRASTWAQLALGDLSASEAVQLGLATRGVRNARVVVLDALAQGPAPYCREHF